ncbi:MAG: mannitol dehydrogenase [Pseudonocardiales bacterium]|nr:MAG: mannitol dehydrogenase [Pseudonocardiales bacterium]
MDRLCLSELVDVATALRPPFDPRELSAGIVHLGLGAFHRAHQAVYTQQAIAATGELGWGICGVSPRSRGVLDQLGPQDGLYTVLTRSADETRAEIVGAIREVLCCADDPSPVLQRIGAAPTCVVTATVTEKGYRMRGGRLDVDDPEIAADLAGRAPRTVVGVLAGGLLARMQADAGPISVLCCDNIPGNGVVLARLVDDFAEHLPRSDVLRSWIRKQVRFPSTMVDRIVPATTDGDRDDVARLIGLRDDGAVVAEPFTQWVIEDDFAADRPRWERAGATMTADVQPYEEIKLRLLNGSHSALAYLGALAGAESIADAMAIGEIGELVDRLMREEMARTLTIPDGFDLDAYIASLQSRFTNPALRHSTLQVAMDGSQKIPQRWLPAVQSLLQHGREPRLLAVAIAGWMRFVSHRRSDVGRPLPLADPMAATIAEHVAETSSPRGLRDSLLGIVPVFGAGLRDDALVCALVDEALEQLTSRPVRAALRSLLR